MGGHLSKYKWTNGPPSKYLKMKNTLDIYTLDIFTRQLITQIVRGFEWFVELDLMV